MTAIALLLASTAFAHPGGGLPEAAKENPEAGSLRVWGQLQTWATVIDQDEDAVADPSTYGDPEHDPGFNIPRARLGINGMLPMGTELIQTRYALSVGVVSPYDLLSDDDTDAQIVDAFGQLLLANEFGPTAARIGQQRAPFGREQLISGEDLVFQDRAPSSEHIDGGREVGATLSQGIYIGDSGMAALRVGVFNGNGSFLGDTDPGVLLATRAELAIGKAYKTFDPDLEPALGVGGSFKMNPEIATNTTSFGGDLLARFKWFTLMGQYSGQTIAPADSNAAPPAVSEPIQQSGIVGQLSAFIPTVDKSGIEIAGRLGTYDDDAESDDLGDVLLVTSGVTWRNLVPKVDAGAGYILRSEGGNRTLANDTVRLWFQFRPSVKVPVAPEG